MNDTLVGFISGGFVVAALNHFLTASAEARHRKWAMRGFLGRWLGRIIHDPDIPKAYADWLEHFWGHYAECYPAVWRKAEFYRRCHSLGAIRPDDIKADQNGYRTKIAQRIQDVISYL